MGKRTSDSRKGRRKDLCWPPALHLHEIRIEKWKCYVKEEVISQFVLDEPDPFPYNSTLPAR
jgi:hypothetical protein